MKSECILWQRAVNSAGYGVQWRDGRLSLAHRLIWQEANGTIPSGMHICHSCDNRRCVNLDHLFLGTPADNLNEMTLKGRRRNGGHKLTDEQAVYVLARLLTGEKQADVARAFGVTQSAISLLWSGKTYRRVFYPHVLLK